MPNVEHCDRCGNDFQKGEFAIHLPFSEEYVYLCHICYWGLVTVFAHDFHKAADQLKYNIHLKEEDE